MCVLLWVASNVGTLFLNKAVLTAYKFDFPIMLTAIHVRLAAGRGRSSLVEKCLSFLPVFSAVGAPRQLRGTDYSSFLPFSGSRMAVNAFSVPLALCRWGRAGCSVTFQSRGSRSSLVFGCAIKSR